jgi:phosphomannomutase/phosphoglucomutase
MLQANIFREYDIRGVADVELTSEGVHELGQAIGTWMVRHGGSFNLTLGRDCRLSSPRLHGAMYTGLLSTGCDVTDLGVVPTPLLYYSVYHLKADGGVMITGSHNPADYNGFKTMFGHGTLHGEEIQEIRRLVETRDFERGSGHLKSFDIVTPYVDEIAAQFSWPRRIKVVSDAGNGTAGPVMRRILEKLNCESHELFFEMDGRFPHHHPDPTQPENLEALIAEVKKTGADVGLAFDGDSDRLGGVAENGEVLYGDQLMILYAREILSRKPGATVIGEVKSSQVMYDDIKKHGGNPIMWKTGHSLIKARMKETDAELAGEMSGHIFFADRYYGYDDAIYAACRLLEIVANSGRSVSSLLADLPKTYTTPEIRVDCPDDRKFAVVNAVRDHFTRHHHVIAIDGARINFKHGWGLVRASNTQPVLVLRFEAETKELLAEYRKIVEAVVAEARDNAGAAV